MLKVVLCNCPPDDAQAIANALVGENLAACVNLIPGVQSIYTWEGKLCQEEETTLLIKTTSNRYAELEQTIKKIHPYDTPEIVAMDADNVLPAYGNWVAKEVKDEENS